MTQIHSTPVSSSATASAACESLLSAIDKRHAVVGVVGLGYVGLPLIHAFVNAGFNTIGYDVDPAKVDRLNAGESYIEHIPSEQVGSWLKAERFKATTELGVLREADAILICVPTPLTETREPDLSYVENTAQDLARIVRAGQLIVLESTTYPSTTRDIVVPELSKSRLTVGRDFFVAYSPEREDPSNETFSAGNTPKVVGGCDPQSLKIAQALYGSIVSQVVPVSSCEVAEACKILENVYRAVNIALVNELKVICDKMEIDVWEVIDAAKTKPFGFQAFYPGPGLGGHCIPIDPFYLSWIARKFGMSTRFIELAGEVNAAMPQYVVQRVAAALNEAGKPVRGSRVAVLGVAYKPNVDDARESPAFPVMEGLIAQGAEVTYNDPHIPSLKPMRAHNLPRMECQELTPEYLASQDCVVITTNHKRFDVDFIAEHASLIVDTRNAMQHANKASARVVKA